MKSVPRLVAEELRRTFRPEFLNRVDETVIFHGLTKEHLRKIVDIQLGRLKKRLAERKVGLELTPAAADLLADVGWDPAYGARPLKRAIQRYVFDPLAQKLLRGEFVGGDTVVVDYPAGSEVLTFAGTSPPPEAGRQSGSEPRGRRRKSGEAIEPEVID